MSTVTCCPLSGDGDGPEFSTTEVRRAAKDHRCCECDGTIKRGDRYENTTGSWDGYFSTYRTCLLCVEIRNHFACYGWTYGEIWNDLTEKFFPDMRAGGPCMVGLSPAAKQFLIDRRMAWYEESAREGSVSLREALPPGVRPPTTAEEYRLSLESERRRRTSVADISPPDEPGVDPDDQGTR